MTTLRFVGDLPLWIGLSLAVLVAGLSWRYYRRESFDLPHRLRWLLPLLRSLAFFLGVMVLTGPVLHHKTIIGQLGRVQIYLDSSNSMTMRDQHMSSGRKLLIAEQLGWLGEGRVDSSLLTLADELFVARHRALDNPDESLSNSDAANEFLGTLKSLQAGFPAALKEQLTAELITPLEALTTTEEQTEIAQTNLATVAASCESIEHAIREAFEAAIVEMINSGDESIHTALAMFDEMPRWRRAQLGLTDSNSNVLTQLRQSHDVEVFSLLGERAAVNTPVTATSGSPDTSSILPDANADTDPVDSAFTRLTDLSSGIVSTQHGIVKTRESDENDAVVKSAVVLISDGQHNAGPSPLQAARVLGSQGVAFYCVSLGATNQAPDLAVIGVEYPETVFQKDRVRGAMLIRDQMPAGKPFVAQITYEDEVLWQEQLTTQNVSERHVEFEFAIDNLVERLGSRLTPDVHQHALPLEFAASITPLADESETSNNQQMMRLAAITESFKVLILDGRPRWETRYLRNAFSRDEQWQVDTVIAGPGTDAATLPRGDHRDCFPADRAALFEYDMVVFGEISAKLFADHELTWLQEFVELRGGGLVFIDGQRGTLRELTDQSIAALLPIAWLPNVPASKPGSIQLTDKGANTNALKLAIDDQQNRRFWEELPAPHNLVLAEALPGSEILAEVEVDGTRRPALVTRAFGAGRVLYMAFDETWRWRYKAADIWHQRIWNQLAQFVMPRPFAVSDEYVSIDSGSVSYDFGSSVDLRIRLMNLNGKPATNAIADALVWKNGRVVSTISLIPDEDVPGIYRGRCEALLEGAYEISVRASGYSESALKARTQFVVRPPESGEMAFTAANEDLLRQMAAASGGEYLREEQLATLLTLLQPLSNGRIVESDTLLWQSYWWFAAIVTLVTLEWTLRKRAGLL